MSEPVVARSSTPHVHAKRERRRREILHAALGAFRERGYHASTLEAIAERLGIRKAALYHYFPDKESILHSCHCESLAELDRIVADARRLPVPSERLRYLIIEHVRVMTDTLDGSPLAFEVGSLSPELQKPIIEGRDRYEREVRAIIDLGIRAGDFRAVDSKVAAFAILGAINWVARWYRPGGELDARKLGEQFAAHLVGGLRAGVAPTGRAVKGKRARRAARGEARS